MNSFSLESSAKTQFISITDKVQDAVEELEIRDGTVTVFVPHTTAGVTINENTDPDVTADLADALDRMVPWDAGYRHSEGNSAAHMKASLMGTSVCVPVEDGRLQLGTWQAIYFCEFDGPRSRTVWIKINNV